VDSALRILVAEDNEDDIFFLQRALKKAGIQNPVHICHDGQGVIDYLQAEGPYADRDKHPFPRMLILDLKMPNVTGLDVLRWLQKYPHCWVIPTVILTSSHEPADIQEAYDLGANAYFVKPTTIEGTQKLLELLHGFWSLAKLPKLPAKC
jgi:CheY-like chemotaxis protein